MATYLGTIEETPHTFMLDDHHVFKTGLPMLVCGNTAAMISQTHYGQHFKLTGDKKIHYGPFDCTPLGGAEDCSDGGSCC